jgi:membrane associated rhomboid family serine protease
MNDSRTREQPPPPPFPWVSAVIIAVCVVVYALKMYLLARWPPKTIGDYLDINLKVGALYPPAVRNHEWWRLVTHAFAHADQFHLFFNMLSVLGVGVPLERKIGSVRFLQLSLVTCVGGAAFVLLFARSPGVTLGASGMILGYAGALLPLISRAQARQLGQLLVLTAVISLLPRISWQAHLGGFLFGLICGVQLRRDPDSFSTRAPIMVAFAASLALFAAYR